MGKKSKIVEYSLWVLLFTLVSCSSSRHWSGTKERQLRNRVEKSPVFEDSFTGFALFDPETGKTLYDWQADKYFTPASNTKIFTFFTALQVLGDSLPVIHYVERGDTLIFSGAGNPLMLHPDFEGEDPLLAFLRQHKDKRLFFADDNFNDDAFGPGWSWADYIYSYQPERSSLPLYGNVVRLEKAASESRVKIYPSYFGNFLTELPPSENGNREIYRPPFENTFTYEPAAWEGKTLDREMPFVYDARTAVALLMDTLGLSVEHWSGSLSAEMTQTLSMPLPDTLYKRLMKDSDNFIAEQLLMMSADKLSGQLSCATAIAFAKDSLLAEIPDPLYWYDGSGLTRYNLFTPRSVVYVLHRLYRILPAEELLGFFPAGGSAGTIKNLYAGEDGIPFVFAKTGTLRNKHCLSGYLKADSGKIFIFSFMHNNFVGSSAPVKEEMDGILRWIKANN